MTFEEVTETRIEFSYDSSVVTYFQVRSSRTLNWYRHVEVLSRKKGNDVT